MRKKGLIIRLAAGIMALSAVSCMKEDNTLRYNNATMGNIVEGTFLSDQGNSLNIVEQTCPGKLDTMMRAFIICDVLNNTAGKEKEFDIRLNYIANVLTKDALPSSTISDMSTLKNDPLVIRDIWVSGGYINMLVTTPVASKDGKKHEINLIWDQTNMTEGTYRFQISHNAQGEVLKENADNSNMSLASAYASFPLNKIIKEDEATVILEWQSYIINGSMISAKSESQRIERTYFKNTFEQVPSSSATETVSALNIE